MTKLGLADKLNQKAAQLNGATVMSTGQMIVLGVVLLVWLAIHSGFAKWMVVSMVLAWVLG